MRVRSGRFEKLRSRETEHAETLEVRDSQHPIDVAIAMAPPASGIRSYPPRHRGRSAQFPQFPERGRASLPMLELDRPQLMPQPFIQRAPDARRLCQPEVGLTPTRVRPCWARQKKTGAEAPVFENFVMRPVWSRPACLSGPESLRAGPFGLPSTS